MFAFCDEVPSSTSLLMQCGYRSKVCTNLRATKLDGTLHKLCEFHRRKANLNQQRLHRRQREKRTRCQSESSSEESESTKEFVVKKSRPNLEPMVHSPIDGCFFQSQYTPIVVNTSAFPKVRPADMDFLELLLLDMQPQTLPPLDAFLPSSSTADDINSIIV